MKKKLILLLIIFCKIYYAGFSQSNCKINNSLEILDFNVNLNYIKKKIENKRAVFTETEINNLKKQINDCNKNLSNEILPIENQITQYSLKMQNVLAYKDGKNIEKQIKALKKTKLESQNLMEKNLSKKTKHSGLFVCVLKNIDPYGDKNNFIKKAEQALTAKAVENLNGTYIKRLTEITNYKEIKDIILSFSNGKVTTSEHYINKALYADKLFLYFAKIQVSPLKEKIETSDKYNENSNAFVIDIINENDYKDQLREMKISEELINEIKIKAELLKSTISAENKAADNMQNNIIAEGNAKIRKLEIDINENERRLRERKQKIKEILSEAGITYIKNNLEKNADKAIDYFKIKIKELDKKWNKIKNKEIQYRETNVSIETSPAGDLAQKTIDLYNQIKNSNLTKVVKSSEVFQINNYQIENYEMGEKIEVFREIEKLWIFPTPQNDGNFKLIIAVKFKITDKLINEKKNNNNKKKKDFVIEGMKMILVKGGTFQMGSNDGSDDEKPVHQVTVSDFYIGEFEVTQKLWKSIMGTNPSHFKGDDLPVEKVSWYNVQDFLKKLYPLIIVW